MIVSVKAQAARRTTSRRYSLAQAVSETVVALSEAPLRIRCRAVGLREANLSSGSPTRGAAGESVDIVAGARGSLTTWGSYGLS